MPRLSRLHPAQRDGVDRNRRSMRSTRAAVRPRWQAWWRNRDRRRLGRQLSAWEGREQLAMCKRLTTWRVAPEVLVKLNLKSHRQALIQNPLSKITSRDLLIAR